MKDFFSLPEKKNLLSGARAKALRKWPKDRKGIETQTAERLCQNINRASARKQGRKES